MPTQNMNSYFQQGAPNPGGSGNPNGVYNNPQRQFSYGGGGLYAGQNPNLGRYRPPMMSDGGNPNSWMDYGGYAYNSPNSYGRPYGGYGFRPQYSQQGGYNQQQYGGQANDVYLQQPRGTGRGGGGFGYGYQQMSQESDPYLGNPDNWNGRQFRGRHPYGTDPGAAAYGDEGLRRFQAQQQAQMMDPMAQWRAHMTGSGIQQQFTGGLDPWQMGQFGSLLGATEAGQSYGSDARPPAPYGVNPDKVAAGYAKPLKAAEPLQYSGTGDYDWGARANRRFRRY